MRTIQKETKDERRNGLKKSASRQKASGNMFIRASSFPWMRRVEMGVDRKGKKRCREGKCVLYRAELSSLAFLALHLCDTLRQKRFSSFLHHENNKQAFLMEFLGAVWITALMRQNIIRS